MKFPPPTKAEILLTKGCNLACSYCALREYYAPGTKSVQFVGRGELSAMQWGIVPYNLKKLGVKFAPIYGAEPLTRLQALLNFIRGCKTVNLPVSVITNGLLLDDSVIESLRRAGLDSITLSHDIVPANKSLVAKTNAAEEKLLKLVPLFKDVEVVATLTRKNIKHLPKFIERMNRHGIWTSIDIYHPDRNQKGSKCKGVDVGLLFTLEDKEDVEVIISQVCNMKRDGYKIHQTMKYLRKFYQEYERYVFGYGWKCRAGSWVTIDSDGSVYGCDDFRPEVFKDKFNILKFGEEWTWEQFVEEWGKMLKFCPGCFWATHFMSDQWWGTNGWEKNITHGRC